MYTIGFKDPYNDFQKITENGKAKKFETIEKAEEFAKKNKWLMTECHNVRIYKGWNVLKVVTE